MRNTFKILLAVAIIVCVSVTLAYSRHYVPALASLFAPIAGHLDAIETSLYEGVTGNPSALLGIIGSSTGIVVTAVKLFKDKTSTLLSTFSNEKASLSASISEINGQKKDIEQTLSTTQGELTSAWDTIKAEREAFREEQNKWNVQIDELKGELYRTEKQLVETTTDLNTVQTQLNETQITLVQRTEGNLG